MKVRAVISTGKIKTHDFETGKINLFLVAACMAAGIMSGCATYIIFADVIKGELWNCFIGFSTDFASKTYPEIFSGLLLSNLPYLLIMYLTGTNTKGCYLSLVFTFLKTYGLGLVSTYIFCCFALKGIEYCLLIFFPGKIFLIFAILLLTENCCNMSYKINCVAKQKYSSQTDPTRYNLRTAFVLLIIILSAVIDLIMIICFSSLFNFNYS